MDFKVALRKSLDFVMGVSFIALAINPMVSSGEVLPLLLLIPAARLIVAAYN